MEHLEAEAGRIEESRVYYAGHKFMHLFQPEKASIKYFHEFPKRAELELKDGHFEQLRGEIRNRADILQTWLFFGLIFTVVQKDGQSLLNYDDLLTNRNKDLITTKNLNPKLQKWANWELEMAETDKNSVRMRMIRLGLVLDKARSIIRNYCSYDSVSINWTWNERDKYSDVVGSEDYLSDEAALSLMIMGETLAAVKNNIMKMLDGKDRPQKHRVQPVDGWHTDQDAGWGQPRYIVTRMNDTGWCPRTVFLLRRQFGVRATLMLNAYNTHKHSIHWNQTHDELCNEKECNVKSERLDADGERRYATAHHNSSCRTENGKRDACEERDLIGPDMQEIERILDLPGDKVFPLLKFKVDKGEVIGLEVEEGGQDDTRVISYATISHVWSDGYGNETSNALWRCQLGFIRHLLEKAFKGEAIRFWMDTLVIPVNGNDDRAKERKKKAIRQIHPVFSKAEYCIVLDKGLVNMDKGMDDEPCQAAMKILASNWMRRLWTLQEAFLSSRIKVAFKTSGATDPLHDIEILLRDIEARAKDVKSILPMLLQQEVTQNMMWWTGNQLGAGSNSLVIKDLRQEKLMQIANSWHAARWRTTSNQAHETLALATLLGLQNTDHGSEEITMAGTENWPSREPASQDKLDNLMAEFWKTVDKAVKGAIPPGIIFLPGEKVDVAGFRWAPRTFMTPDRIDYPDPLSLLKQETVLVDGKGLRVECPGFFLHIDSNKDVRNKILQTSKDFCFPIDSTFVEWYNVEADAGPGENKFAAGVSERTTGLAVILSRPSPRESPAEIGLLVEVCDTSYEGNTQTCYVQVLFRIRVSRLRPGPKTERQQQDFDIFGEVSGTDVRWCVDGYNPGELSTETEIEAPSQRFSLRRAATSWLSII